MLLVKDPINICSTHVFAVVPIDYFWEEEWIWFQLLILQVVVWCMKNQRDFNIYLSSPRDRNSQGLWIPVPPLLKSSPILQMCHLQDHSLHQNNHNHLDKSLVMWTDHQSMVCNWCTFKWRISSTGFLDNIPWKLSNLDKCFFTTDHSFFHHEFRKHVINKRPCHERLCCENKVLHLMFYYELKLYWMKVCWFYERSWIYFFHICTKK